MSIGNLIAGASFLARLSVVVAQATVSAVMDVFGDPVEATRKASGTDSPCLVMRHGNPPEA